MDTPANEAYLKQQESEVMERLEREVRRDKEAIARRIPSEAHEQKKPEEPNSFFLGLGLYGLAGFLYYGLWFLMNYASGR